MNRPGRHMSNVWAAVGAAAATVAVVALNPSPVIGLLAVGAVVVVATPYMTLDSGRFLAMILGCGFVAIVENSFDGRGRTLAEFGGFVVLLSLASRSRRWVARLQRYRRSRAASTTSVASREVGVEIPDARVKKPLRPAVSGQLPDALGLRGTE